MAENRAWITRMMLRGKIIIDIGLDRTRISRGQFYRMETCQIRRARYPLRVAVPFMFTYYPATLIC